MSRDGWQGLCPSASGVRHSFSEGLTLTPSRTNLDLETVLDDSCCVRLIPDLGLAPPLLG